MKMQPYPGIAHVGWAFQEGREAGRQNNTVRRGIMLLGLGFAASYYDALNVKNWLNGFALGQAETKEEQIPCGSYGY